MDEPTQEIIVAAVRRQGRVHVAAVVTIGDTAPEGMATWRSAFADAAKKEGDASSL